MPTITTTPTPDPSLITVTGRARREYGPDKATVEVTIEVSDTDRARAYSKYQERLRALDGAVEPHAVVTDRHPTERSEEDKQTFRTVERIHLKGTVTVTFAPEATGSVLAAIIESGFVFRNMDFGFRSKPSADAELLGAAATDARQQAEAVASALGCQIIKICRVTTQPEPTITNNLWRRLSLWPSMNLGNLRYARATTGPEDYDMDETLFDVDDESVPVREITAEISIVFELAPAA